MANEIKFEEILKKLEKIVDELEHGDLSLDDALKKYQEGIKLSALCSQRLDSAKKKIEIMVKDKKGNIDLKPFDEREIEDK